VTCWSRIDARYGPEASRLYKVDVAARGQRELAKLYEGSVWVSAKTGENLDEVIATIGDRLRTNDRILTLQLPFDRADCCRGHREGDVHGHSVSDDGVLIHVVLDDVSAARLVNGASRREFSPPAYPYDAVDGLKKLASVFEGVHRLFHRHAG